jgi:hypothetical protein
MLRDMGHEVVSPAELDAVVGFNPYDLPLDYDWNKIPECMFLDEIVKRDTQAILDGCTGMYMLDGWEKSDGASAEFAIAKWKGLHIEFESEGVSLTDNVIEMSTAIKHDDEKPRWDLLPMDVVEQGVLGFTHGAAKYAPNNWRKGMRWGRLYGALQRHLTAFWRGEDIDKDSGLQHLALAQCELLMLHGNVLNGTGEDDRWKK